MAALNWSVFCVTLALILSVLHPCHSIRLLLTCIVMDTHALVADPHFSVPHCRSLFSIIHLTRFFSPLVPFFSPFFPFMSPITTPFYISHYVTLLLRHAFFPFFLFYPSSQPADASVQHVWTLCEDEATIPKAVHAQGYPGGVPLHEGPGPPQHQWVTRDHE